jgi:hypothetical protein
MGSNAPKPMKEKSPTKPNIMDIEMSTLSGDFARKTRL